MTKTDPDTGGTEGGYSLNELSDLTGVSTRTVRYYIQQGLLPAAPRSGPGARYPEETLPRLRFIRTCQEDGLALAHIRERLEAHVDPTGGLEPPTTQTATPKTNSALDYLATLRAGLEPPPPPKPSAPWSPTKTAWERLTIDPNLELHVRRPLSVTDNRRLDRLLQAIEEIYGPQHTL